MNSMIELAAGEYELQKPNMGHRVTMPIIERRFGLRPNQLCNYFANLYRNVPITERGLYRGIPSNEVNR